MLSHQENELLTRSGPQTPMGRLMRRYWVPTLYSSQQPEPDSPPLRVKIMGEDLVAFRDRAGRVGLLGQHCPHRGASLFFGRNEERGLRCVYHGWKYDVNGTCVDMPNEPPESNFKDKIRHLAYPCQERGGVIWTYMGPPQLQPALPELEWMLVPESHRFATRHIQECNWLQALEGGFDTSHVQILHQGFAKPVGLTTAPRLEAVSMGGGFMLATARDIEGDRTHWGINQWLLPWYKLITRQAPDAPIGTHAWVPMDDESCMVWSIEYHPDRPLRDEEIANSGSWTYIHLENLPGSDRTVLNKSNDYLIDRQLPRNGSYTGIRGLGVQDTAMQESMGPIYDRSTEHLGAADLGIINIRHQLLGALKDLEQGNDPPGLDPATHHVRSASVTLPKGVPFSRDAVAQEIEARSTYITPLV